MITLVKSRQQKQRSERNSIGESLLSHYSLCSFFVDKLQHKQVFNKRVLKDDQMSVIKHLIQSSC